MAKDGRFWKEVGGYGKEFGYSKAKRLTKPEEFRAVFNQALCSKSACFTILARPNDSEVARLGVMVAKRFIKSAVQRNRIRRIIRESFRHHQQLLLGLDLIVMARNNLSSQQNAKLFISLERQWKDLIGLRKKGP